MSSQTSSASIGDYVEKVSTVDPATFGFKEKFCYIDIGAINRETKKLENISEVPIREAPSRARQLVCKNDVLVSTVRPNLNAVAMVSPEFDGAVASTAFTVLRANPKKLNPRYLYHWVRTPNFVEQLVSKATGVGYPAVSDKVVKNARIPCLSLLEQERIAALLDKADALRQNHAETQRLAGDLVPALFYELFGDPRRNNKRWKKVTLNDVCEKITDGTHFSPPNLEEGIPYVSAKHVKSWGLDFFAKPTYISNEAHKEIYSRCNPVKGDVLYIKDGATTGLAAVNEYDFEFSMLSSVALFKPLKGTCNGRYLAAWLNDRSVKEQMLGQMGGAAIRRLTLTKILVAPILIPPIELQEIFSKRVIAIEKQKKVLEKRSEQLEHLAGALQQLVLK